MDNALKKYHPKQPFSSSILSTDVSLSKASYSSGERVNWSQAKSCDYNTRFQTYFVTGQPIKIIVCEHVLAHKRPDKVQAAYLCGAYLKKRKGLMADRAIYFNP